MSKHLQEIIDNYNQISNCQVVFLDIEKYSKRRTSNQVSIINAFTTILNQAINEIAKQYIENVQKNDFNFSKDLIKLPTGDGAAIVFTFDGMNDVHFEFAKLFMKYLHDFNSKSKCEKFENNHWCNCHDNFSVRISLSEGKGIIYKDINESYNLAGNAINMAARLLGEIDGNQIILSEETYTQLIDLSSNANLDEDFLLIPNLNVKHSIKLSGYLYIGAEEYINSVLPEKHLVAARLKDITGKFRENGFPIPDFFSDGDETELSKMKITEKLDFLDGLSNIANNLNALSGFDTISIENE